MCLCFILGPTRNVKFEGDLNREYKTKARNELLSNDRLRPNLQSDDERIAERLTKMRFDGNANKVNSVDIYRLATRLRGFCPMLKNGYMRGRLDGAIENLSVLYTSILFYLDAEVEQQRLGEYYGLEFI